MSLLPCSPEVLHCGKHGGHGGHDGIHSCGLRWLADGFMAFCPAGLPLTGLGLSSGAPSARPMLPSRGRNTIDDDTFFDSLAQLLSQVMVTKRVTTTTATVTAVNQSMTDKFPSDMLCW